MAVPIGGDDTRSNNLVHFGQSQQNASNSASQLTAKISTKTYIRSSCSARFSRMIGSGIFFKSTTCPSLCVCSSLPAPPLQGANPKPLIPTLRRQAGSFPFISFGTVRPHIRGWTRVSFENWKRKSNLYTAGGFSDSGRWPAKL
jgi:hypothetical protein